MTRHCTARRGDCGAGVHRSTGKVGSSGGPSSAPGGGLPWQSPPSIEHRSTRASGRPTRARSVRAAALARARCARGRVGARDGRRHVAARCGDRAADDRDRAPGEPGARRPLVKPRDEAGPAVPDSAAQDRGGAGRRARRRRQPPGLHRRGGDGRRAGLPQRAARRRGARGCRRGGPGATRSLGPRSGRDAAPGQRGVRVGQPDRAAPHRQRARRVRGRSPLPRARGCRSQRRA